MKVRVDSWAWLKKEELGLSGIKTLKSNLTFVPRKPKDIPGPDPEPLELFTLTDDYIGVPRQYFIQNANQAHDIDLQVTEGDMSSWPGDIVFNPSFRLTEDQRLAVETITGEFNQGSLGSILQAGCGWGKTVGALAIIARMNVPTLITVHKGFLMNQWKKRISKFLPDLEIGIAQQKKCDYKGKHIVIAMNDSLSSRDYGEDFYNYFGLVVSDECHRCGAPTWSQIPPLFKAKWRLGLTATPRRGDRMEKAFFYHIGDISYRGVRKGMVKPQVKRVFTNFRIPRSRRINPHLISRPMMVSYLVKDQDRNEIIVDQILRAAKAERKILVLSERLGTHLKVLEQMFREESDRGGFKFTTDFIIGGRKEAELELAEEADVIFATSQYAREALDIPELDTLIIATPMGDAEQAAGRITRDLPGKKTPIIVDIRDDHVTKCQELAEARWRFYQRAGWV